MFQFLFYRTTANDKGKLNIFYRVFEIIGKRAFAILIENQGSIVNFVKVEKHFPITLRTNITISCNVRAWNVHNTLTYASKYVLFCFSFPLVEKKTMTSHIRR